jgi:hypothetical protein
MVVAGFVLTYREQWRTMWIVSWCVTVFLVLMPGLFALLPARVLTWFDSLLDRAADMISVSAHRSRNRKTRPYVRSVSGSTSADSLSKVITHEMGSVQMRGPSQVVGSGKD